METNGIVVALMLLMSPQQLTDEREYRERMHDLDHSFDAIQKDRRMNRSSEIEKEARKLSDLFQGGGKCWEGGGEEGGAGLGARGGNEERGGGGRGEGGGEEGGEVARGRDRVDCGILRGLPQGAPGQVSFPEGLTLVNPRRARGASRPSASCARCSWSRASSRNSRWSALYARSRSDIGDRSRGHAPRTRPVGSGRGRAL